MIEVRIAVAGEGVEVTYTLPGPARSLALGMADGPVPDANIRVREEGLAFTDGRISGSRPFTRATLLVLPDRRERDGVYPLARVVSGQGFVVYAPYLLPSSPTVRVRVGRAMGRPVTLRERALDGYVLVGAIAERQGSFRFLSDAATPPTERETILERSRQLLAFYRARLRRRPAQEPTIILSQYDLLPGMSQSLLRGDVSANGVVFLRTYVGGAAEGEPPSAARYTRFLAHELFHLWNRSGDVASRDSWLVEGGAEYVGWLGASTVWPGEYSLEQSIGGALRTCMMYLGPQPMAGLDELQARSVRYPCGAVIQWAVDAAIRADRSGRDVFAIWRRLLARRERSGSYRLEDFRNAVSELAPRAEPVVESILNGSGMERWDTLADSLNAMGAQLRVGGPADFALRLAAAKALVLSSCGEIHGVGENDRGLFVQAPPSCDAFGDSPVIEEAAGVPAMRDASAFYRIVREHCAARTDIMLLLSGARGRRTQRVLCRMVVTPPPPEIEVVRAFLAEGRFRP